MSLPDTCEPPPRRAWWTRLETMTYPEREDPRVAGLVGASQVMRRTRSVLARQVDRDTPVLLVGERGTGKTLAARLLHEAGPARDGPFQVVFCDAPRLEEALFGVGDRPGVLERGGTLLLKRADWLKLEVETRLFRVFTDRHVLRAGARGSRPADVPRLIFACHGAPPGAAPFTEPRLAGVTARIDLWPLRERRDDVPLLIEHLLRDERSADGHPLRVKPRAVELLARHGWPGNVAELARAVRELVDERRQRDAAARPVASPGAMPPPAQGGPAPAALLAVAFDEPAPTADPPVAWRSLPAPPRRLRPPRFTRDGAEAAVSAAVVFTAIMLAAIHLLGG